MKNQKETIRSALASEELSYQRRGTILGSSLTGPSRSLREQITADGVAAIEREFQRAYENVESDPGAAVTAGCAILEAVCKTYLEEAGEPLPDSQTLKPLWNATARSLGLNPKAVADEDLRRVSPGCSVWQMESGHCGHMRVRPMGALQVPPTDWSRVTRVSPYTLHTRWLTLSWRHGRSARHDTSEAEGR